MTASTQPYGGAALSSVKPYAQIHLPRSSITPSVQTPAATPRAAAPQATPPIGKLHACSLQHRAPSAQHHAAEEMAAKNAAAPKLQRCKLGTSSTPPAPVAQKRAAQQHPTPPTALAVPEHLPAVSSLRGTAAKRQRLSATPAQTTRVTSLLQQGGHGAEASQVACDFGIDLAHALTRDGSIWALKPDDPEQLSTACMAMFANLERSAPAGTLKQDKSHWRWWVRWCKTWNTPPMRTDYKANMGADWVGARREAFLQAASLPWILCRMKARGRAFPLPTSALQVILGVRRVHRRLGFELTPFRQVTSILKQLMHDYCERHGPESLLPHRKSPYQHWMVVALLDLCRAKDSLLGTRRVQPESIFWTSLTALIAVMAQSGLRKAEVTSSKGFGKKDMSRASLYWVIQEVVVRSPTLAQLLGLKPGDYAALTPPPAKADQFGAIYGGLPMYFPFDATTPLCAARELQRLELRWPVSGLERRSTPLFADDTKAPFKAPTLDTLLRHMLLTMMPASEVASYSWHSFRIFLACSLLKGGATGSQIQALCRWQSERSLRVYARLACSDYAALLMKANGQDISQTNTSRLPALDEANFLQELHLSSAAMDGVIEED